MNRLKKFYITISVFFVALGLTLVGISIYGYTILSDLQSTIKEMDLRIDKISETEKIFVGLEKRYEQIKPEIEKINRAVPDKKDASVLVADINSIANQNGLKLTLIQSASYGKKTQSTDDPGLLQTIKGKNSYEMPIEIKVEGSFTGLAGFVRNLENYQRIINISAIEVNKLVNEKSPTNSVEAKIKLTAYLKK